MKKLVFICQWGRKRNRTWSGTSHKVLMALSDRYDIQVINISSCIITVIKDWLRKHNDRVTYDFGYRDVLKFNSSKQCKEMRKNVCVFQFTELEQPEGMHSYIYQDMCVQYIHDSIMTNRNLSPYFYKNISEKIIEDRLHRQREYYKKCKGIFVMGQWLKDYMIQEMNIPKEKIFCVGAGYDVDVSKIIKANRNGNRILFVGRDFRRKGGDYLLEAFKLYKRDYNSQAELFIAGFRDKKNSLEGVYWLGDVSSDELVHYYCTCDILCMPSFLEPFGKAYVEALCCGMPVIALNRFATPDFIKNGHNGYLLDECTPVTLAEKMDELMRNDVIKRNAVEEAEYYQKEYSWDAVAERISSVIDKDEYFTKQ